MKIVLFLFIWSLLINNAGAQEVRVIDFKTLKSRYTNHSDTSYVIHFFASWCVPCLKEMPILTSYAERKKKTKTVLLLVSLDLVKDGERVLEELIRKHNIQQPVYLLNETNGNTWIGKMDRTWTGSIPATFVVNNKKRMNRKWIDVLTESKLEQITE